MDDAAVAPGRVATFSRRVPWALITTLVLAAILIGLVAANRPVTDTLADLGARIRCPVCQGIPIAESPSPMARDMMGILRETLESGATREEAIDAVLGAYPGSLLLEPDVSTSTIALWLVPLAAVVAGVGLALTVRRGRSGIDAGVERAELLQRRQHIGTDLDELAVQEAAGEVESDAARHLRRAYRAEMDETEAALAAAPAQAEPPPRSRRRVAWGATILVGSLLVVVALAGAFLVDRPDATSGVADVTGNPADYSNETLAAVIAANLDHPQIDGMRLALAERFFEAGDYPGAFPYYLDVASSERATDAQASTALTRLGWMTFDGNGEVETALDLLAQARRLAPTDPFPQYLEGIISWCGLGDLEGAATAFRSVLDSAQLDESIRGQVASELEAVESGTACPT